jgi:hypothetical protein
VAAATTTEMKDERKKDALDGSIKHDLETTKGKATPDLKETIIEAKQKYPQEEKINAQ